MASASPATMTWTLESAATNRLNARAIPPPMSVPPAAFVGRDTRNTMLPEAEQTNQVVAITIWQRTRPPPGGPISGVRSIPDQNANDPSAGIDESAQVESGAALGWVRH